jgi:uncharacterized protein (DUF302 family)
VYRGVRRDFKYRLTIDPIAVLYAIPHRVVIARGRRAVGWAKRAQRVPTSLFAQRSAWARPRIGPRGRHRQGKKRTIARLKNDIADKGIKFFAEIDQTRLAEGAGVKLHPSTLLVFGNPPLGTQLMTSNPNAGLDWPVRLLVVQDENGEVWTVYTDFEWIKRRHHITDRDAQFKMAATVIASITASVKPRS